MRPQRAREGESRVEMQAAKWTAEGAVNEGVPFSILRRAGIRQLPGICLYPAECAKVFANQGGTAEDM